ncbi:OB-fold-containig protein [uncultured Roseobacter sp.]|uniref:OB-fold-containig protein n=1 Tax=uncultured Roseobacter sp. TaxID=114847 RepID=UPI0026259872|nr:OB-fold-containig protein [uncultured Roseobacter sp.]
MFDLFLTEPLVPFTLSLALLFGLLALEALLLLIGGSLLGAGAEADVDVDFGAVDLADLNLDLDAADLADVELADIDADYDAGAGAGAAAGPAAWLGFGKVPVMIWIAALLLGFGLSGLVVQQLALSVSGAPLLASVAIVPASIAGVWFARQFSVVFARLLPKTETTALSARHLGRRTGRVTQGTARRGSPAEVRVTDRYGNVHYLRGEPLKDDEPIPAGSEVLVLRHRRDQGYRLVPLAADA